MSPGPIVRAATTALWASFFLWLWLTGGMTRYIGPRTSWVVPFGAIVLVLVAIAQIRYLRTSSEARRLRSADVMGASLLLLPLVAVAVVPSADLGSLAASRKEGGVGPGTVPREGSARVDDPSFIDIEYAGSSARYARVTGVDEGRQVELLGFVSEELDRDDGTLQLTRFYISCCAADAIPHSVSVDPGDAGKGGLVEDQWVEVSGRLERREDDLVVVAASMKLVDPPDEPYLY